MFHLNMLVILSGRKTPSHYESREGTNTYTLNSHVYLKYFAVKFK